MKSSVSKLSSSRSASSSVEDLVDLAVGEDSPAEHEDLVVGLVVGGMEDLVEDLVVGEDADASFWVRRYLTPQALHNTFPEKSLRHWGVLLVPQDEHRIASIFFCDAS